jgi:branched-chain amino acid transport system permease protein
VRLSPRAIPAVLVGVLGAGAFLLLPGYLLYAGSTALVSGLIGLGLFLPIAALREMPLNAAGIAGLSAYLFAHAATGGGVGDHLTGILLGLGVAVGLSVLTGLGALVVTGLYFVVASLVVQVGIEKVAFSIPGVTGGASGWSVAQPELSGWFDTQRAVYLITAAIVLVLALAVRATLGSRLGFRTVLVGHVPEGASSMGLRNWAIKLLVFAMSGLLIGIGGLLIAFVNG